MITMTFVEQDGTRKTVEAQLGLSVMEVAVRNNVQGIAAECGGQCSCATCHVFVDAPFFDAVGAPVDDEEDMLDFSASRQSNSRLGCRIEITEDLDGMVVHVAGDDS